MYLTQHYYREKLFIDRKTVFFIFYMIYYLLFTQTYYLLFILLSVITKCIK